LSFSFLAALASSNRSVMYLMYTPSRFYGGLYHRDDSTDKWLIFTTAYFPYRQKYV